MPKRLPAHAFALTVNRCHRPSLTEAARQFRRAHSRCGVSPLPTANSFCLPQPSPAFTSGSGIFLKRHIAQSVADLRDFFRLRLRDGLRRFGGMASGTGVGEVRGGSGSGSGSGQKPARGNCSACNERRERAIAKKRMSPLIESNCGHLTQMLSEQILGDFGEDFIARGLRQSRYRRVTE